MGPGVLSCRVVSVDAGQLVALHVYSLPILHMRPPPPLMWGRARRVAFSALKVWTVGGQFTAVVSDFTFELMSKPCSLQGKCVNIN